MFDSSCRPRPLERRQFASDNYAGICPEAWAALAEANIGHVPAYGGDCWTHRATELLRDLFEHDCDVFFTFNGTAANSLALAALCQSYHSIICHELAHIETDECGGPEFFSNGTKLLLAKGDEGRIDSSEVARIVHRRKDLHYPQPRVLSLTQATELGTTYSVAQLAELGEAAKSCKLRVHMDGARFSNAVASLKVSPAELTWKVGVDVLCFGGTKNGMAVGEAVIFFNHALAEEFASRCKQSGQLASKMRFLAAPWVGLLETGAWLKYAQHSNEMAARLDARLRAIPGVSLLATRQANSVFIELPENAANALREKGWRYYTFIGSGGARFMCSWDTTPADVDALAHDLEEVLKGHTPQSPE